jgi:3-phosphoinositide dependent protein kinase-1
LARRKETEMLYAIKVVNKNRLIRYDKVDAVKREKSILLSLRHDGIVRLRWTFQDELSLCMLKNIVFVMRNEFLY